MLERETITIVRGFSNKHRDPSFQVLLGGPDLATERTAGLLVSSTASARGFSFLDGPTTHHPTVQLFLSFVHFNHLLQTPRQIQRPMSCKL